VAAVLVAGTTGEASSLDPEERRALIAAVRAAVPPAVPVLAGTGAPSDPAEFCRHGGR
jgi:4-hydroxy-tetrahydrodipicolinate synthase